MAKKDIITIEFHGHQLETFKSEGQEWVSITSLCKGMGLDVWAQQRKLQKRTEKFSYRLKAVTATDGKEYETACIPVKKVPGWLFTVDADRVKPEAKQWVELFQAECFDVLYDYWHVADLLLEMTSRVKNTLNPLITALGTTTHATQSEANAFWRKRRERSFTRLAATVGGAA